MTLPSKPALSRPRKGPKPKPEIIARNARILALRREGESLPRIAHRLHC